MSREIFQETDFRLKEYFFEGSSQLGLPFPLSVVAPGRGLVIPDVLFPIDPIVLGFFAFLDRLSDRPSAVDVAALIRDVRDLPFLRRRGRRERIRL
jgi:hypothetical protein